MEDKYDHLSYGARLFLEVSNKKFKGNWEDVQGSLKDLSFDLQPRPPKPSRASGKYYDLKKYRKKFY